MTRGCGRNCITRGVEINLTTMLALARHASSPVLRALVTLMLVAGLLVRPLVVIACDIEDVGTAIAAGQGGGVVDAGIGGDGGDCCASIECGECCAPSPLVTPALARLAAHVPVSPQALPDPPASFEPMIHPVDARPPIEG